jgi:SAM-dependent methyltransferase
LLVDENVKCIIGDALDVDLPGSYFTGVFVSNFLEHLAGMQEVHHFLRRMHLVLAPGGRIAVLGPNFRHLVRQYFDFADHVVPLTHLTVAEHLNAAGFTIEWSRPRFIPYSFTGRLPASPALTQMYLRMPVAWRVLGKQFLVLAHKEADPES